MKKMQLPPLRKAIAFLLLYAVCSLIVWALITGCDPGAILMGFASVALNGALGAGIVWAVDQINEP